MPPNAYNAFNEDMTAYVPENSIDIYKESEGWSEMIIRAIETTDIKDIYEISDSENINDKVVIDYYDIHGCRLKEIQKGLMILKFNDGSFKKVLVR